MPRYACHHALRLLTPSKIRILDTHHHFHTTHLAATHRIWDPSYPTFLSVTHTQDECSELGGGLDAHASHSGGDGGMNISYEEQKEWREKLMGKRLINGDSRGEDTVFNVQSLPAGQDPKGPTCTRIIGPLKGTFFDTVDSRLTIHVDENDIVWDVYFG
ncbi:hypothetical protein TWF718_001896 [Orbilia javanica]|uniref:Uncharacterized protein n=1 Tax=Orbilia javanica TaxID=47235 RepID=A0AAN8N202_9PEZI